MVYHQCEFFHVSSNHLIFWICFHNESSWTVCHQCELSHESSNILCLITCSHTGSSWMVYHQCGFFNVSSNNIWLYICSHIGSSWMVFHQYAFSNAFPSNHFVWIPSHMVDRWIGCFLQSYCVYIVGPVSIRNWVLTPDIKAPIEWWKCLLFMLALQKRRHKTNWKWISLLATKGKDLHSSIEAGVHKNGFSGSGLTGTGKSY